VELPGMALRRTDSEQPVRREWLLFAHQALLFGTPQVLVAVQRALAVADAPPWRPPTGALAVGACVVCFARGGTGAGAAGDPAWAAAAVPRGRRVLAESIVAGEAGAPYLVELLELCEGTTAAGGGTGARARA
jgi:hypothetical protein